ncbi:MAG: type II toxin-antitoxin system RelE/ParE family toxin [Gammaproteobacteria bacterium]|nr:type II toxin-antitoxin system RelE/ParE family toxin [Gammaproteobacteria bacterium]NND38700.1 type II toxin-antitoxin system RelE/ParE family toxin [Pseudomonadales bacterium]RZV50465.1 MAG: hypothetical protein EX270_11410 [Pseudomonadales bacterium]
MHYRVRITRSAARDIDAIAAYLNREAGHGVALQWLEAIEKAIQSLATHPQRGANPKDIARLSAIARKQLLVDKYRVIYQISKADVCVEMVVDARRNVYAAFSQRMRSDY